MLKNNLKEKARQLGFASIGFADAAALKDKHTELAGAGLPPFVPWEPCQRCDPSTWLPGARTVIAGAWPYRERYHKGIHVPGPGKGYFSPFASAPDYHSLVKEKLQTLADYLCAKADARAVVQVDSGPGCERMWAGLTGIGWQGKNNFLIVPGHGSLVWLGLITTDVALEPDKPQATQCGDCERCLKACPTEAYSGANQFHHQRCLAWYAANKGELSLEAKRAMAQHKTIYGCDLCQLACPHNSLPSTSDHQHPMLKDLLELTGKGFRESWQKTSAGWRGKKILIRNAILAAAHDQGLREDLLRIAQGEDDLSELAREVLAGLGNPS